MNFASKLFLNCKENLGNYFYKRDFLLYFFFSHDLINPLYHENGTDKRSIFAHSIDYIYIFKPNFFCMFEVFFKKLLLIYPLVESLIAESNWFLRWNKSIFLMSGAVRVVRYVFHYFLVWLVICFESFEAQSAHF